MLRLLAFAAVIYFVYYIVRSIRQGQLGGGSGGSGGLGGLGGLGFGRGRVTDKCRDCRNCGKIFDDGVICRFGGKETFKNETHVGNCIDWKPK
jgi:hypothetical protein